MPSAREKQARSRRRGCAAGARAMAALTGQPHHRGHPAVSEREYTDEESAYLRAVEEHRRRTGRYLLVCDYLAVARALGYHL